MAKSQGDLMLIRKEKAQVVAWTSQFRIEGTAHKIPKARISDLLNRQDILFIPMTDVVLYSTDDREILRSNFLAVNKNQITVLSVGD